MKMLCPYCNNALISEQGMFVCPNSHGTLIFGGLLAQISEIKINDDDRNNIPQVNKQINCPNCHKTMIKLNYNDTGILIDSCPNCPYRWLDRGEISKIKNTKAKILPDDLLFMSNLQYQTQKIAPSPDIDDPTIVSPEWESYIQGRASNNENTTLGLLAGMSFYGLVTGMIKSKFYRIVGPIFIIIFIVLGYLLIKSLKSITK